MKAQNTRQLCNCKYSDFSLVLRSRMSGEEKSEKDGGALEMTAFSDSHVVCKQERPRDAEQRRQVLRCGG
jgi:hypothetical protein